MKKALCILLALAAVLLLAGCGKKQAAEPAPGAPKADTPHAGSAGEAGSAEEAISPTAAIDSFVTLADAFAAAEPDNYQAATYEDRYVYVFLFDDTYFRVTAPLSAEVYDRLSAIDIFADDAKEQESAILSPLAIETRENVTAMIPVQAELDRWVGKTGGDLLDDGWYITGYYLDEALFYMNSGMFEYTVTVDGKLTYTDDFDEYEAIRPLTVKSVVFTALGDATNLD